MKNELKEVYGEIERFYATIHRLTERMKDDVKQERSLRELADISYAMREIASAADQIRKKANGLKGFVDRVACLLWSHNLDADPDPIRTEYCTAQPVTKMGFSMPDRDSDEHEDLLDALGIHADDPKMVKLSFTAVTEFVNAEAAAGRPLPEGLETGTQFDTFELQIRKKKGILE